MAISLINPSKIAFYNNSVMKVSAETKRRKKPDVSDIRGINFYGSDDLHA